MYLDSAILVKLATAEPDSGFYVAMVDEQFDLFISALSLPECRSALARKLDSGEIDPNEYAEAWAAVEEMFFRDVGISVIGMDDKILERASDIIERCRGKVALRALDAIHIATCMCAEAYPLVTNDRIMRKAAEVLDVPLAPMPA